MKKTKCIICGEVKNGTEEHIIPDSLGNKTLKIYSVCKECNSNLGKNVDNYLINNFLMDLIRQDLKLKGKSGKIPNPFKVGKDKNGDNIYVDEKFKPRYIPKVKNDGKKIEIMATSEEELKQITRKTLKRLGWNEEEISNEIEKNQSFEIHRTTPIINYEVKLNINKIDLAILKIAYEYTYYKLGNQYYNDKTAIKIRNILYKATKENYDEVYDKISCIDNEFFDEISPKLNIHIIFLQKANDNMLVVGIILFNEHFFSRSICVSENADEYKLDEFDNDIIQDIIEIQN